MRTPEEIGTEIHGRYLRGEFDAQPWFAGDPMRRALAAAIEADRRERDRYVLSFEPDAIRDHFEVDDNDPTDGMTDDELLDVAATALQDDRLYAVFHELLVEGLGA